MEVAVMTGSGPLVVVGLSLAIGMNPGSVLSVVIPFPFSGVHIAENPS